MRVKGERTALETELVILLSSPVDFFSGKDGFVAEAAGRRGDSRSPLSCLVSRFEVPILPLESPFVRCGHLERAVEFVPRKKRSETMFTCRASIVYGEEDQRMCGCVCSRRRRLTVTSDVVREEKCECNLSSENIVSLSFHFLAQCHFFPPFVLTGEREGGEEDEEQGKKRSEPEKKIHKSFSLPISIRA